MVRKRKSIDLEEIEKRIKECSDVVRKQVNLDDYHVGFFFFIKEQVNNDLIQRDFIGPILTMGFEKLCDGKSYQNIPCSEITLKTSTEEIIGSILQAETVFVSEALPYAISCKITNFDKRAIDEPVTEKNIRGPHDGFIEVIDTNLSILRRRIENKNLKFKTLSVGSVTKQTIAIAYIEGIANKSIVDGLYDSISQIKTDGLSNIGHIEQYITSRPNSLFPEFLSTERPDKASAALLEGRIVVLQNGTPVVLIAPISFISFFQSMDDYSTLWLHGSFLRLIRIAGLLISIMLPALYIAVTSFHYFAVPLDLLITLAESRAKVPFPPIIEVLILEVTVEMVREAAIRLPTYIGTAISVFAGLVIGQAAVEAGLVSGLLIVIVAATAVATYVIPSNDMALAIRILRFIFIIVTSIFGMIGIVVCTAVTVGHLMSMDSLGQPYMQPFSPLSKKDLKDTFIRLPMKKMKERPLQTRTKNSRRGGKNG